MNVCQMIENLEWLKILNDSWIMQTGIKRSNPFSGVIIFCILQNVGSRYLKVYVVRRVEICLQQNSDSLQCIPLQVLIVNHKSRNIYIIFNQIEISILTWLYWIVGNTIHS